jgi:hypothetical protein
MKKLTLFLILYSTASFAQWDSLGNGVKEGYSAQVFTQTVYGGDLYVGGQFDTAGHTPENGLGDWNGVNWNNNNFKVNGLIVSSIVYNGNLIEAGNFDSINHSPSNNISQWNGSTWSALGTGIQLGFGVEALAVYNGNLIAGGVFANAGGNTVHNIAMWNGSTWSALGNGVFNTGTSNTHKTGGAVFALGVYNGNLYAGGKFDSADGVAATNIAMWNGSNWSSVGTGFNDSTIGAFTVFNNELYVGGFLGTYNNSRGVIYKWDGSNWSPVGNGYTGISYPGSKIFALCVFESHVCAAGRFDTIGGTEANCIAWWNGSNWEPIDNGIYNTVNTICVYNTELYAGGYFTSAGNTPANNIAAWSGNLSVHEIERINYIKVFPNPSNGVFSFNISNMKSNVKYQIDIYNVLGEKVCSGNLNQTSTKIDLSNNPSGIYMYRINTDEGDQTDCGKLIMQ